MGEPEIITDTVSGVNATTITANAAYKWEYYIGTGFKYVGLISHTGKYGNSIGSGEYNTYTLDVAYDADTGYMTLKFPRYVWEVSCSYIAVK